MVSLLCALAAAAACLLAEWIHRWRVRRVAYLAFGSQERPRRWVGLVTPLRVVAAGAATWGLATLLQIGGRALEPAGFSERSLHHLVIALDVSPSMHLVDAGPQGTLSRGDRARDTLRAVLSRLDERRTRVSVVAFYSTARPVIIDTFDPEVTANVLADLPLEHAFTGGKTDLHSGVKAAGELGKAWREGSATLLVVSDGDTLPSKEIPQLPRAFSSALVVGVGSPLRGTFIDGHSSRQDVQSLERLALQLHGRYHDANVRLVPHTVVDSLSGPLVAAKSEQGLTRRGAALVAVAAGSLVLAILPVLLVLAGVGRPFGRVHREEVKMATI